MREGFFVEGVGKSAAAPGRKTPSQQANREVSLQFPVQI
jgi:hypothetical protein